MILVKSESFDHSRSLLASQHSGWGEGGRLEFVYTKCSYTLQQHLVFVMVSVQETVRSSRKI